jgi:hypothetical protein
VEIQRVPVIEFPVTFIHPLICLLSHAFHKNGKFIMQIPEVTQVEINEEHFTTLFKADAFTK